MVPSYKKSRMIPGLVVLLVVTLAYLAGCAESNGKKSGGEQVDRGKTSFPHSELSSANYYLTADDLDKFRPGRLMGDVLRDVQWRGNFKTATTHKGKSICSITYFLLPRGATNGHAGEWVLAIFIDDKFVKFVKLQPALPDEMEEYYDRKYKRSRLRLKPIKVGDCRFLIRAVESAPIDIVDLEKEISERPKVPSHIDPGLTAVVLLLKPALDAKRDKEVKKNAALRDQFNAVRLKIGMTESEVESVLKAKPLESGKVEAGSYEIYGSNESLDISRIHFSNILVVFKEGKVTAIYRVHAGYQWRRKLGELFIDLPVRHEGAGTKVKKGLGS